MSAAVNLVVFAMLWQKALLQPIEQTTTESIEITTTPSDRLEKMGQGIEEIPLGTPEIKTLNLAYNHISTLPEHIFYNRTYKSLTHIELNQNKITTIHVTAFRGLRQLTTVALSANNLTSLDPYVFKHNPKLEKLDLSRNKIVLSRLRVFLVSQSLQTLIVSQNNIEQVYELSFMGVPNLRNLVLDGNSLNAIAPNSFKSLNKLQYLSLANTGVYRLSESMFSNDLPRIIDLQETPLGKRFEPPLRKITNDAVRNLINIEQYILMTDV